MSDASWLPVLVGALVAGLGGLLVPALVRRIPEPAVLPEGEAYEEKEPYAAIAAAPGLAGWSVVAGAATGALVGRAVGWSGPLLWLLPLVPVCVALAVVDWRTRLLPTVVVNPLYPLTAALVLLGWLLDRDSTSLVGAVVGLVVGRGLFWLLWLVFPRGMGFGDVRLAGVLGLALGAVGWAELGVGLYAGFLLGGVGGGLLSVLRIVERKAFPFGPFMLVGAVLGLLVGGAVAGGLAGGWG